ncbi:hypothetical protein LSAT2_011041 [Lamellibrachia satsuma]|nr:hypothetical protein LSAT2_011041 [Lamellibrachia satsuma]
MTGRDMRSFVTNHRAYEAERLVRRMKDGLVGTTYRAVDYSKMKTMLANKRFKGHENLIKVKKLQHVSKLGREQNLLKQHKKAWQREWLRLNTQRRKLQADFDLHMRHSLNMDDTSESFEELEGSTAQLDSDFVIFKRDTVEPVWSLREDLQYWVLQHEKAKHAEGSDDPGAILKVIDSVKGQQERILVSLQEQQQALEQELTGILPELMQSSDNKVEMGIPPEAYDLDCSDDDLRASVLQEFIIIDCKYNEKLNDLEDEHEPALRSETGGWSAEDDFIYQMVVDQYGYDVPHRRTLYLDRLRRHLLGKTRAQLVEHEDWSLLHQHYRRRRHALLNDWSRHRLELLNRAKVVFAESKVNQELAMTKAEYVRIQRELCDLLYAKVRAWQEQKLEAMALEHHLAEQQNAENRERMKEEEEREREKRNQEKEKIKQYRDVLDKKREAAEEQDRRRLILLQERLAEQAAYDRERVKYREQELQQKEEEQRKKEREKEEWEREKERRLEALREQVRPHVEGDLLRVWKDTESWQARLKTEVDVNINKPLFDVNSFTSHQVTADPRFRLEARLREAGLQDSRFALEAIANMKPLHAPRRDMESNVFNRRPVLKQAVAWWTVRCKAKGQRLVVEESSVNWANKVSPFLRCLS